MTDLAVRVWDSVCRHIDGMVIGSTMAALEQHGALKLLTGPVGFGALREQLGARAGYLNVAIRLLADQGFVTCTGEPGTDEVMIEPTAAGREVIDTCGPAYAAAASFLPLAARIDEIPPAALGAYADLMRRRWDLPQSGREVRRQVLAHLDGHLLAPIMYAVARLDRPGLDRPGLDLPALRPAAEILALAGWATLPGATLTAEGRVAAAMAGQYRYPMVYLPLLRQVPELLFGPAPATSALGATETHLDRELDLRFSGDVFAATCRTPFLEIALPLFDGPDQPALVVDTGCGDGGVLATLYEAVRTQTERALGEFPLLMVGADPSPVARRVAAQRLSAAGVPHLILDGDIADPARLRRDLAALGHDAGDALHVCKSAIHDRAYRPPTSDLLPPPGTGAYAQPDGTAIAAGQLARNLAEFFRDWHPLTRKHGWIVIEAHAVPAATIAGLLGRTVAMALDATHGYSCQYPVEPEVFAWAARTAGFRSREHAEPGAGALGHTLLTIDHFVDGTQTR